jgi:hypothetical protein
MKEIRKKPKRTAIQRNKRDARPHRRPTVRFNSSVDLRLDRSTGIEVVAVCPPTVIFRLYTGRYHWCINMQTTKVVPTVDVVSTER